VSGQSPIDPPEPAASVASGPRARRLVYSDPLNEPDHVIDVRNLLAKSGSSSRRHPMASHRHQLRSSTLPPGRSTAAIVPPASARSGCTRTSPSDLTQEDRHSSTTGPNSCGSHWGAKKASTGCPQASARQWGPVQPWKGNEAPRCRSSVGALRPAIRRPTSRTPVAGR
jgi:hypothetical protein